MYLSWSRLLPFGYVVLHLALASTDLLDPVVYPFGPPWNPVAGLVLALLLAGGGLYVPLVAVVAALAQVLVHGSGLGTALAEGGALALIYGAAAHGLPIDVELLGCQGRSHGVSRAPVQGSGRRPARERGAQSGAGGASRKRTPGRPRKCSSWVHTSAPCACAVA